jgi:two-component system, NtrC family, response regulator AlgB
MATRRDSPTESHARPARVLIVDDDKEIRHTLALCLDDMGCDVAAASSPDQALAAAAQGPFDLAFVDLRLGEESGLDLLPLLLEEHPNLRVVVLTGFATTDAAVDAVKRGAADFIAKPFTPEQIRQIVAKLASDDDLSAHAVQLPDQLRRAFPEVTLESQSTTMLAAIDKLIRAAKSDAPVLLRGEPGVGKEVLARVLHAASPHRSKPFVAVSCFGVPEEQLGRELFGTTRAAAAFVQIAAGERRGAVEMAAGGTLLLDDITELPSSLQAKIARLLDEQRFERVGEARPRHASARIIASSSRDIESEVGAGLFDENLFFRLNVVEIDVPPLRERLEDIVSMARHFLSFFAHGLHRPTPTLSAETEAALTAYKWPGNVRELRNAMERAIVLWPTATIEPQALPEPMRGRHARLPQFGGNFTLDEIERRHVQAVLARTTNLDEVARILGIDVSTLWRKRKKYEAS